MRKLFKKIILGLMLTTVMIITSSVNANESQQVEPANDYCPIPGLLVCPWLI